MRCSATVSKELPIENKVFFFDVGENPRGRFLRVSESGAGYVTFFGLSFNVPIAGLADAVL